MRCLALEIHGFSSAKIIEWISLEHTAKNTMIVATRADDDRRADHDLLRRKLRALAAHNGVTRQRLCDLLGEPLVDGGSDSDAAPALRKATGVRLPPPTPR